jgi:hypothetical protein
VTEVLAQRLVLALEANTLAQLGLAAALQVKAGEEDDRMVSSTQLGKVIGLNQSTCYRKMLSGEFPSFGEGRTRRCNLAEIKNLLRNTPLVNNF